MLKATIDADIFRESIDAIAALVTECRMHVEPDRIFTRAVDTANVAMVSLQLQKEAFETFQATKEEMGLDIAKLKNMLGMMSRGDTLNLTLPEGGHRMEMAFNRYRYAITLLDVNTIRKDPNPPTIELPGKVVLTGEALQSAIKAATVVSDKIALGIDPEKKFFYMVAEGDTDHIRLELAQNEVESLSLVEVRSLFSLDYLKDMGRVMGKAEKVEVHLGVNHPVKFSFDIAGGKGHIDYLLAPRIEAE